MLACHPRRRGLSWAETLITLAVVAIAAGLIVKCLQRLPSNEGSSARGSCMNNLRQMATAVHNFHSDFQRLPEDDDGYDGWPKKNRTFYTEILPYLAQLPSFELIDKNPAGPNSLLKAGAIPAVKTYLCPSRRSATFPRDDYAAPHHVAWTEVPNEGKRLWYSILGTRIPTRPGVWLEAKPKEGDIVVREPLKLAAIVEADGTACTLLLAHKGMAPSQYLAPAGPNDEGFPYLGNTWEHKRLPFYLRVDHEGTVDGFQAHEIFTSPHPGVCPCAFADGSVRSIRYGIKPGIMARLCSWNDGDELEERDGTWTRVNSDTKK